MFGLAIHLSTKIKSIVRKAGARTHEALTEAMANALSTITPHDAAGCFNHYGYKGEVQYLRTPLSNNATLAQDVYGFRVEVEFFQDTVGMLTHGGDRSHNGAEALHRHRRQEGS